MGILSEIGRRLQTDIADSARAVVDPKFSQQLTQDYMRDKQLKRSEKAWLERHSIQRQQALQDQARSEKFKIQMGVVGKVLEQAEFSGNYSKLIELQDRLDIPQVKNYAGLLASTASGKSEKRLRYELDVNKELNRLSKDERDYKLKIWQENNDLDQWTKEQIWKKEKFALDNANKLFEQASKTQSSQQIRQFFETNPEVRANERSIALSSLAKNPNHYEHAAQVYKNWEYRRNLELQETNKSIRNAQTASALRNSVDTPPQRTERTLTNRYLNKLNEEGFINMNLLTEEDQELLKLELAAEAKAMTRTPERPGFKESLPEAFERISKKYTKSSMEGSIVPDAIIRFFSPAEYKADLPDSPEKPKNLLSDK